MGVLYCFDGGAARGVGIQVNLKFPRGFATPLRVAAPPPRRCPGHENPARAATEANFRAARRFRFKVRLSAKMSFYSHGRKIHFHKKGFDCSLVLKVRVFGTRKWLCS